MARPPYRAALLVALAVLAVYVATLAPTVTFWDAGEFIAAARVLGIPHPPGTPLFVLIAHAWALVAPVGEFAARTNLLSAMFSAAGAGCFFLVVYESMRPLEPPLRLAGAAAAALLGAFTFTNWQNSNETEVYAVATFTIALMCWLALVWRRRRRDGGAPRLLLLIVYLAGLSVGNHLLALLAGPAVVAFLVLTLRAEPSPDMGVRRAEWGQVFVVGGVWALLVGVGLGSTVLASLGAACFLAAAAAAASGGAGAFAALSLLIAAVGVTPYLYLYLRSAQHPPINEAAPATFDALLAVIRRAQYPPRTPLDDPTVASGADNPGRSLSLMGVQLLDYIVWFDWQWAKSIGAMLGPLPVRTLVTLCFASLGLRGWFAQRRSDRAAWWLVFLLWLVTGLGLVAYMNFRPGYGRWFDIWPQGGDHEVRERDYFFVVSFIVWGLWAGIGLAALVRDLAVRGRRLARVAPAAFLVVLVPIGLNWRAADRRHVPDARLASDFAYDLLNSVPPYGILFTYGDNDTFPLWWAQEVAGIRRDVTVVCMALANTDWYMRQLRHASARALDPAALPAVWRDRIIPRPEISTHALTDSMIATAMQGYVVRERGAGHHPAEHWPAPDRVGEHDRPELRRVVGLRGSARARVRAAHRAARHVLARPGPASLHRRAARRADHRAPGVRDLPLCRPAAPRRRGPGVHQRRRGGDHGASAALLVYAYAGRRDQRRLDDALEIATQLSPNPGLRAALEAIRAQALLDSAGVPSPGP